VSKRRRPSALLVGVLVVVGLLAVLVGSLGGLPRGRLVEIIVPEGTQARLDRGESVSVMPALLELHVGDRLRIDNRDVADQLVGPYFVRTGEVVEISYGAPGRYEGMCALSGGQRYELIITP
jgi:hypothetical protein